MAKQLNVSLSFTADANAAKREIQSLQQTLNNLAKFGTTGLPIGNEVLKLNEDLREGMHAAAELQAKLESAVNVKTGKLDLNRFNSSLKQGKTSLQDYAISLSKLGEQGVEAFNQVANAIVHAEAPIFRVNSKIKELGVSLANTARWQLSSSIVHGLIGGMQKAYYYAQSLNRSLNDIRIVTGYSAEQMKDFAVEANKAAKALSTTTTNYTNASLIYYQQGLSDEEVKRRTDVTVKMANVTGETSEKISSQMTAVWNNFAQGSNNLEYFADVLVKLGAYTASSADEITAGLEKFSSVAQTIGLSYEYASSALATITATTRESADVAGTALRTLFSRIQGLTLGETQDDGTNLNKYSEALSKVGINIKDTSGELKDMDTILNELGNKWTTLRRDQQMALAQTVAGVRQYNQLITLMNNWDYFQELVGVAKNSTGELDNQAKIFEESWLGASKRVQAAAEEIYNQLLKDDAFIALTDTFSDMIGLIADVINGLGGLKGVLFTVGGIATKVFQKEIANGLRNTVDSIRQLTPKGRKEFEESKLAAVNIAKETARKYEGSDNLKIAASSKALMQELNIQESLVKYQNQLNDEQLKQVQIRLDGLRGLQNQVKSMADLAEKAKEVTKESEKAARLELQKEYQNKEKRIILTEARKQYIAEQKSTKTKKGKKEAARVENLGYSELEDDVKFDQWFQAKKDVVKENVKNKLNQLNQELQSEFQNLKFDSHLGVQSGRLQVFDNQWTKITEDINNRPEEEEITQADIDRVKAYGNELDQIIKSYEDLPEEELKRFYELFDEADENPLENLKGIRDRILEVVDAADDLQGEKIEKLKEILGLSGSSAPLDVTGNVKQIADSSKNGATDTEAYQAAVEEGKATQNYRQGQINTALEEVAALKMIKEARENNLKNWSQRVTEVSQVVMDLGSIVSSVQGVINVFNNPDATAWEKVVSVISLLSATLGSAVRIFDTASKSTFLLKLAAKSAGISLKEMAEDTTKAAAVQSLLNAKIMIALAAIAAVVAIALILANAYNADAKAAERAAKASQEMADSSEEVANRTKEVQEAFDGYKEVRKTLDECVKGTDEWNEALKNVNDNVIDLLKKYPELSQFLIGRDNGVLTLDEEKVENYIKSLEGFGSTLNAASLSASAYASKAQDNSDAVNLSRQIFGVKVDNFLQNIEEFAEPLTKDEFRQKLLDLGIATEKTIDNIVSYQDTVQNLAQETTTTAAQIKNAGIIIANSRLGGEASNTEIGIAGKAYSDTYNQKYEEYVSILNDRMNALQGINSTPAYDTAYYQNTAIYGKGIRINGVQGNATYADIWKVIQEETGKGPLMSNALQNHDGGVRFAYQGDDGEIKYATAEWVASVLATREALKNMEGAAAKAAAALEEVSPSSLKFANAMAAAYQEDGTFKFGNYTANLTQAELATLASGELESFYNILGTNATDFEKLAETYGVSAQELINFLVKSAEITSDSVAAATEKLDEATNVEDLSAQEIQRLANAKENVKEKSKKAFNEVGAPEIGQIEEENADNAEGLLGFFEGLNNIDLQSENAEQQLADLAEQYNITGKGLELYIKQVKDLDKSYNVSTTNIATQAQELQKIIGNGLDLGDVITPESFNTLKQAGINVEEYFSKNASGTYTLTRLANEFNEAVNNITLDALRQQQQDYGIALKEVLDNAHNEYGFGNSQLAQWILNTNSTIDNNVENQDVVGNNAQNLGRARLDYLSSFDAEAYKDFGFEDMEGAMQLLEDYSTNPELELTKEQFQIIAEMIGLTNDKLVETSGMIASITNSQAELNSLYKQGLISIDEYNQNLERVQVANLDKDVDEKAFSSLKDTLNELSGEFGELSENVKDNETALGNISEAVLRFDNAIQDVTENYDDWLNILKTGSIQEVAEVTEDLADAYGDLLDMDNSSFSTGFLRDTDNLKLMKKAAEGSAEAYETLQQKARQDIEAHIDSTNLEEFKSQLSEVESAMDAMQFQDLEIGANLNIDGFLQSLSDMVNAAGMTAAEAESYLSSLGIDAEVTENDTQQEMVKNDLVPKIEYNTPVTGPAAGDFAQMTTAKVPTIRYEAVPQTYQDTYSAPTLKVMSATKSSGGNFKFKQSSHGGGTKNPKKSSGGGGGSGKKEPKLNKNEIERYHEIKNTLEDLTREYDRVAKARDRAYGMTKVALIQEEIEKTKELAEAQKQYMTEINDNLIDDQKALAALGATFDSRGNINNYDSLVAGWVAEFNASLTDEAEKAYQDKVDALNQYEETHDLWQDEYDKLIDYYNQIVDLELEAITVEVDFKIELSEKEIERVEYEIEKLTRSRTLNIDIQINKMGDYIPEYMKQSKEYQDAIQKIYDSAMKYGLTELTQDQWDTIKDYQSKLLELNLKMLDKVQEVEEKFNEAIDKMTERFDEAEGRFETYGSVLEHFSDTMELLGMNTKDFATYQKLLQQRMDTSIATIDNNKKRLDTYNQALAETKEALARAVEQGDQENILFWQEKVRELETASEEAYEAFISSWQSTIEAATEFFESKVEAIIQHFKDNLFVDGLDAMADKLDKVNDVRERYLDDFDRWYEISKLNREIDKEIDDTSNLSAKRRLADFQKEILKYQEEGALMSQYDLDHARARYELLLAEIALEEARNAKNTVQLKRDSEGNWGYVYTADQDKIAEAEQNYEDKLHDMQEAAKDYRDEMESQVIDALNNMFEELGGLDKNAADYQEKAWKIYQFYYDKLQYLAVEFDKALADSNSTLADTVFADEGIMTDFLTYITKLMNDVKDAPEQLINQYKDLQDTIRKANESAGIDSDNFSNNVIVNIDWVNGKTEDLAKDMDSFMEDISDSITKVIDTIQTWKETYLSAIRDMMAANEKWNLSSYEVPAGYDSWEDYFKEHPPEIDWDWKPSYTGEAGGEYRGYMVGNESNSGTSGSSGNANDSGKKSSGGSSGGYRTVPLPERRYDTSDADDVIEEFYNHGKESQYAMLGRKKKVKTQSSVSNSNNKNNNSTLLSPFWAKLVPGLYFGSKYDTGGYTGDWGTSDGKVALLHEKELVLNKKDTANILDSVNIVRDMNNQINRNIRYASFAQQVAAQIKGQLQNELKQNVEIQATFPSVTNSSEIEDAFNNLVNAAAQYVNSKIQ